MDLTSVICTLNISKESKAFPFNFVVSGFYVSNDMSSDGTSGFLPILQKFPEYLFSRVSKIIFVSTRKKGENVINSLNCSLRK